MIQFNEIHEEQNEENVSASEEIVIPPQPDAVEVKTKDYMLKKETDKINKKLKEKLVTSIKSS